jgi:hypothetical protein
VPREVLALEQQLARKLVYDEKAYIGDQRDDPSQLAHRVGHGDYTRTECALGDQGRRQEEIYLWLAVLALVCSGCLCVAHFSSFSSPLRSWGGMLSSSFFNEIMEELDA